MNELKQKILRLIEIQEQAIYQCLNSENDESAFYSLAQISAYKNVIGIIDEIDRSMSVSKFILIAFLGLQVIAAYIAYVLQHSERADGYFCHEHSRMVYMVPGKILGCYLAQRSDFLSENF